MIDLSDPLAVKYASQRNRRRALHRHYVGDERDRVNSGLIRSFGAEKASAALEQRA